MVAKNGVKFIKESVVVDHACAIIDSVAGNELLDLRLSQCDVEGTDAGAELFD